MNFKQLNDEQLVENIRENNCSDSVTELMARHHGLIVQVMKRYANVAQCSGVSLQDFLDDAPFIVFDAASDYKPEKNIKFTTWLGNKVRFHCLDTLNQQSKYYNPEQEQVTTHLMDVASNEEELSKHRIEEQMDYILNILTQVKDKRVETIIKRRYFSGGTKKISFSVIAKELKMSTQGVIDLHNSFVKFIGEKIQAEENMDKI